MHAMPGPPPPPPPPGPVAEAAAPVRVRRDFPETWLWAELLATGSNDTGEAVYEAKAPDTITSWVASAFAISEQAGLGVAPSAVKLRVFRPFFIRLELPYSVKRGEKLALQVLVFNYLENEQDVTVTLKHQEGAGFDFLQKDSSTLKKGKQDKGYNVRLVSVPGGGASKAVYFPIAPTQLGQVRLSVVAQSAAAGDAVEQSLRVEPEGYRVERNVPLILELADAGDASPANGSRQAGTFRRTVELQFPADAVEGSQRVRVDLIGDLMGPVLASVDALVQMPHGCGEQNMLTLVPNIVVVRYLRATHRRDGALEAKALGFIQSGYQRELIYKRTDNSFSAFGESDSHGSTWLTAFVIRSYKQAQAYVFVDEQVIERAIAFLISQQQSDTGAFAERGEVHHKQMQGGAAEGGPALTAYVLVALLENHVHNERAKAYLEHSLEAVRDDAYALAVIAYALQLAKSAKAKEALKMLEAHQLVGPDGHVHWAVDRAKTAGVQEKDSDSSLYFYQPQPVDIETSAYALLTYMALGDTERGLPVVRWLTSKRNALGGFSSTQDTVMALQALGAYAERVYSPHFNVTVLVQNGADSQQLHVNAQNSIVLQSYELPTRHVEQQWPAVELSGSGSSVAFAQVQYSYHRVALNADAPFHCTKDVRDVRGGSRLQLELCCNYTGAGGRSNMALAEVDALSGHKFDAHETAKLTSVGHLQRVELEHDDTKANLYFNPLGHAPVCLSLYSDLVYQVADHKPAQLRLVDYYDPEQQVKATYSARQPRSLQEGCPDCWPEQPSAGAATGASGGKGSSAAASAASCRRPGGSPPLPLLLSLVWSVACWHLLPLALLAAAR